MLPWRVQQLSLVWLCTLSAYRAILIDMRQYHDLITMAHNLYRRHERSADMKELTWDPSLQRRAEEWSEQCYWGHQGNGLGENLAYFWTTGPSLAPLDVILRSCQNWWKEVNDWTWGSTCEPACHYTQMIWGKSERIGCSLSKCSNMATESGSVDNADYFVCFYDPPGNFIGRFPYTLGDSCTKCAASDICNAGLCLSPAQPQRETVPKPAPVPQPNPQPPPPPPVYSGEQSSEEMAWTQPMFYEWK